MTSRMICAALLFFSSGFLTGTPGRWRSCDVPVGNETIMTKKIDCAVEQDYRKVLSLSGLHERFNVVVQVKPIMAKKDGLAPLNLNFSEVVPKNQDKKQISDILDIDEHSNISFSQSQCEFWDQIAISFGDQELVAIVFNERIVSISSVKAAFTKFQLEEWAKDRPVKSEFLQELDTERTFLSVKDRTGRLSLFYFSTQSEETSTGVGEMRKFVYLNLEMCDVEIKNIRIP